MNILVIPTTDWTNHPHPNRLNHIFDRLAKMGHAVHVLHFEYLKYRKYTPRQTNCNMVFAGYINGNETTEHYYLANYTHHKKLIKEACAKLNIDVILSANILPSHAAIGAGVPIVYDYLDVMDEAAGAYLKGIKKPVAGMTVRHIMKKVIENAQEVITVSPSLAATHVMGRYKKPASLVNVIPNGVDTSVFKPYPKRNGRFLCGVQEDVPVIGYVGSVENWIDFELAIDAMKFLHGYLTIVGTSLHTDYIDKLKERAKPMKDHVRFIGNVPYETLPMYISGFDVGINPLRPSEHNKYSAGGKIYNYFACGVPCVSSMCDPGADTWDKLYTYSSPDEYVNRVFQAVNSKQNSEDLINIAKRYDWNILAKEYEKVLMRACGKYL